MPWAMWLALTAWAWQPRPVADDPLAWMPGTPSDAGVTLAPPSHCLQCHAGYDPDVEPVATWQGSMMSQSARDPLFWPSLAVALQDAIWAFGTPNAADPCLRCHAPEGWVEGRADPSHGGGLVGSDHDGVHCDTCHRQIDPFHAARATGVREGSDWVGYWDETGLGARPSAGRAAVTLQRDKQVVGDLLRFDGELLYDLGLPTRPAWTEASGGSLFFDPTDDKRGPMADDGAHHTTLYSRFHKSRDFCSGCHDVSNPALANAAFAGAVRGDGVTVLPTEDQPGYALPHLDRTASEMRASVFGQLGGAPGAGAFAPGVLDTSRPGDVVASCQDCHMADLEGVGCNLSATPVRPTDSVEHPKSGVGTHRIVGGNPWASWVLAATRPGSTAYDPVVHALLGQGPAVLTADLEAGLGIDAAALLDGRAATLDLLAAAATLEDLAYDPVTGVLSVAVVNHTGHKLPTGFGPARRAFLSVTAWQGDTVVDAINVFDPATSTIVGMPADASSISPPAVGAVRYDDTLVYEERVGSSLLGVDTTHHLLLADTSWKDNRIPPRGWSQAEATARGLLPVVDGLVMPDLYDAAERAGGRDDVTVLLPAGATRVDVRLSHQAVTPEYVAFVVDELTGAGATLSSPTPSGEPEAYIVDTDPFFDGLRAWAPVLADLWDATRQVEGAAPVLLAHASWGCVAGVEVPGDGVDGDCDGRELCAVDADRDGDPGPGLVASTDLTCRVAGVTDPARDADCWDGSAQWTRADVDGDGVSSCAGDCDDDDAAVTACPGAPWLTGGEPLTPGARVTWRVTGVPAGRRVAWVSGRPGGPSPVPGCGGGAQLDLDRPGLLGITRADANGTTQVRVTVPPSVTGRVLALQAVVEGSCAVTNVLVRTGA